MNLIPHPDHPPLAVTAIEATVWRDGDRWHFRYLLEGTSQLVLPDPAAPGRTNDLWQTTCFEAFVSMIGQAYREYNFSPSGEWAAYAFDSSRQGMRKADTEVETWFDFGDDSFALEATMSADFTVGSSLGLTAVIEEQGGRKSYWALAHPANVPDAPPDFHDPSCFLARLPE